MARLSLYRPTKSNDYKFIDRTIYEMFQVGGTDVWVHKYIGPVDPTDPSKSLGETTIQDVLFMENRDRKYDNDVYMLRGHYTVQDNDLDLTQFGIYIQQDSIFMTVHLNDSVARIGRKMMSGDVIELPHLIDEHALREDTASLKRFYVVTDVNRAADGFSVTWYPHLYRLKLKPIINSQEFRDIFNTPADNERYAGVFSQNQQYYSGQIVQYNGKYYEVISDVAGEIPTNQQFFTEVEIDTIADILSSNEEVNAVNTAIVAEAEKDSPLCGYDTAHFYVISRDNYGRPAIITTDSSKLNASSSALASKLLESPRAKNYDGWLLGDGLPTNGGLFGFGMKFPEDVSDGDYFLRTDYHPTRLFKFNGRMWEFIESNIRMTLSNTDERDTLRWSFVNNTNKTYLDPLDSGFAIFSGDFTPVHGSTTESINIISKEIFTNVAYDPKYGVQAFVMDNELNIEVFNGGGFVAFRVKNILLPNDRITYKVYKTVVDQRQSLSQALRPRADL